MYTITALKILQAAEGPGQEGLGTSAAAQGQGRGCSQEKEGPVLTSEPNNLFTNRTSPKRSAAWSRELGTQAPTSALSHRPMLTAPPDWDQAGLFPPHPKGPEQAGQGLLPFFMEIQLELQRRQSIASPLTQQDCHQPQTAVVAKAWPLPPTPPTLTCKRTAWLTRGGAARVRPMPLPGPHMITSGEGRGQELEASRLVPRAWATGWGGRGPAEAGTSCALSFRFHCGC